MTLRVPLIITRPKARVTQQPMLTANLNVGTLATAAASVYFMNDTGTSVRARRVQQPDQQSGLIQLLTFVSPSLPKNNYDWPNPKIARRVQRPDQPNGMIQRLTFVAPTLPFNNYDWPNPKPIKPVPNRLATHQGQNPGMITAAPVAPTTNNRCVASPAPAGRMMTRG